MRLFLMLVVCLGLAFCETSVEAQDIKPPVGVKVVKAPDVKTPVLLAEKPERLGLFQRRRLGLTIKKIAPVVKQLQDEGRLTGDSATDAVIVADLLIRSNPEEFKAEAGADWDAFFDALIEFLEKLIPLILQLFSLFGL